MRNLRKPIEEVLVSTGRRLRDSWGWAGRAVDSLLFPSYCPICEAETGGPAFCDGCRRELLGASGRTCARCAMPVGPYADRTGGCSECRGVALGFDRAVALGPYQGPIRSLCLSLKHERNAWIGRWLGELIVEGQLDQLRAERIPQAWVVPVPLHWRRRLSRGYNQAEALAVGVGRGAGTAGQAGPPPGCGHAEAGPGGPDRTGEADAPGVSSPRGSRTERADGLADR